MLTICTGFGLMLECVNCVLIEKGRKEGALYISDKSAGKSVSSRRSRWETGRKVLLRDT